MMKMDFGGKSTQRSIMLGFVMAKGSATLKKLWELGNEYGLTTKTEFQEILDSLVKLEAIAVGGETVTPGSFRMTFDHEREKIGALLGYVEAKGTTTQSELRQIAGVFGEQEDNGFYVCLRQMRKAGFIGSRMIEPAPDNFNDPEWEIFATAAENIVLTPEQQADLPDATLKRIGLSPEKIARMRARREAREREDREKADALQESRPGEV